MIYYVPKGGALAEGATAAGLRIQYFVENENGPGTYNLMHAGGFPLVRCGGELGVDAEVKASNRPSPTSRGPDNRKRAGPRLRRVMLRTNGSSGSRSTSLDDDGVASGQLVGGGRQFWCCNHFDVCLPALIR